MKFAASIGRAFAAIVLTGIVSSLIFAVGFTVVGLAQSGKRDLTGIVEFVSAIWFVGAIIALACAIIIGLGVEWPKSYWLLKRSSAGWWISLIISLLAAEALLHSFFLAEIAARGMGSPDLAGSLVFSASAAAVGGACSAAFWWWLVVMPGRNGRGSTA